MQRGTKAKAARTTRRRPRSHIVLCNSGCATSIAPLHPLSSVPSAAAVNSCLVASATQRIHLSFDHSGQTFARAGKQSAEQRSEVRVSGACGTRGSKRESGRSRIVGKGSLSPSPRLLAFLPYHIFNSHLQPRNSLSPSWQSSGPTLPPSAPPAASCSASTSTSHSQCPPPRPATSQHVIGRRGNLRPYPATNSRSSRSSRCDQRETRYLRPICGRALQDERSNVYQYQWRPFS